MRYIKFFESFICESKSAILPIDKVNNEDEAKAYLKDMLAKEKSIDDELSIFDYIWWMDDTSEVEMVEKAKELEDKFLVAGRINNKYYYAYTISL